MVVISERRVKSTRNEITGSRKTTISTLIAESLVGFGCIGGPARKWSIRNGEEEKENKSYKSNKCLLRTKIAQLYETKRDGIISNRVDSRDLPNIVGMSEVIELMALLVVRNDKSKKRNCYSAISKSLFLSQQKRCFCCALAREIMISVT